MVWVGTVTNLYRRIDAWTRNLSRGGYAALVGILTGVAVLIFSLLLNDWLPFQAALMTLTMATVYYILDPNSRVE